MISIIKFEQSFLYKTCKSSKLLIYTQMVLKTTSKPGGSVIGGYLVQCRQ